MSKYVLNPRYVRLSIEEIFDLLISSIKIGEPYETLSGNENHKIISIKKKIIVERLNSSNKPQLSFEEIKNVIALFKTGKSYNTNSKEYVDLLDNRIHKTPLLSILLASNIILKS